MPKTKKTGDRMLASLDALVRVDFGFAWFEKKAGIRVHWIASDGAPLPLPPTGDDLETPYPLSFGLLRQGRMLSLTWRVAAINDIRIAAFVRKDDGKWKQVTETVTLGDTQEWNNENAPVKVTV